MRKGMWIVAAVIMVAFVGNPVRAADTRVAMGSSSDPLAFLPADITVPVGSTVEWFNETDFEHDVQAEDGSFGTPGSDLLGKGEKYEFKFSKAGKFPYFCTPHKGAGMVGTVTVTAASATPPPAAPTPTTAAPAGATTTTAKGAPTTTTTRAGAGDGGAPTTTTTAGLGVTSTTQAASTTPTSAPEAAEDVTTTTGESHGGEEAAADHGGEGSSDKKTNALAVGLAGILTVVLAAISIKLLTGP